MRFMTLAVAAMLVAGTARADDFRAVVDRVELEPAAIPGTRLRVFLSALSLDGHILDLADPKSLKLTIGGSEKKVPYALGEYKELKEETAIVFVIQTSASYTEALPAVIEALDTKLLAALPPDRTQIAVLAYGDAIGTGKLAPLKTARAKLTQVATDGSSSEPAMLETVEKALKLLKRAKTEAETKAGIDSGNKNLLRKMIIVVGDGVDRTGDRERVSKVGKQAAKENVRIHSLAFSSADVRRPLLALGELSKQSLGTFRWIRSAKLDSWTSQIQLLVDEIMKQYVITWFLPPDDDVAGKKLKVITIGRTEATSNEFKIPDRGCAGAPCAGYCASDHCVIPKADGGRGFFGWILLLGGIGLGAVFVLGLVGYVLQKRQPAPLPPGVTPPVPAPGTVPPPGTQKKVKPPKGQPVVPQAPVAPVTAPGPCLFIMSGPRAGERVKLMHGFTIGKDPSSSLVIDDGFASTNHAQIGMDHFGNCRLYDRGSTNGTLCNGVRVSGEYVLQHGVVIQIGNTQLRFLAE